MNTMPTTTAMPADAMPVDRTPVDRTPADLMPPPAEMERAYLDRDAAYNGLFFLGVRTTGIFCRPTCTDREQRNLG